MRALLISLFLLTSITASAVTEAFGWEFGLPKNERDRPQNIEGEFLQLNSFTGFEKIEQNTDNLFNFISPSLIYKATLRGRPVFLKGRWTGVEPEETGHNQVVRIAEALSTEGVGAKFLGSTFFANGYRPEEGRFMLVFDYIEGKPYLPVAPAKGAPRPRKTLPKGVRVTEETVRDINHSFDVLDRLGIKAKDAQFLLTQNGRAYLVDYEFFRDGFSEEDARAFNNIYRSAYLGGIRWNLDRCGRVLVK